MTENDKNSPTDGEQQTPRVFLSYASEDKKLAKQVAKTLQAKGIKTWFAEWEIISGDSIPQKINEGIEGCTHFLVLLTQQSIKKPWVEAETSAAFFRKLEGKCRFIPVLHKLSADKLPPLLQSLYSPEIESGTDIDELVSDIYEINKKPPLGKPPATISQAQEVETGYSPAVSAVARLLVTESKNGLTFDPQSTIGEIATAAELGVAPPKKWTHYPACIRDLYALGGSASETDKRKFPDCNLAQARWLTVKLRLTYNISHYLDLPLHPLLLSPAALATPIGDC